MKSMIMIVSLIAMSGCISQSDMQFRMDQAARNERQVIRENEELSAQLNALRAQKSSTETICETTLAELHQAAVATENAAKSAYEASRPLMAVGAENIKSWIKEHTSQ